jgi:hypothetical protein
MHRELKQLVGTERCQCRAARSQRNHIACCYQACRAITIYAAHADLWRNYLKQQLRSPDIKAYAG